MKTKKAVKKARRTKPNMAAQLVELRTQLAATKQAFCTFVRAASMRTPKMEIKARPEMDGKPGVLNVASIMASTVTAEGLGYQGILTVRNGGTKDATLVISFVTPLDQPPTNFLY